MNLAELPQSPATGDAPVATVTVAWLTTDEIAQRSRRHPVTIRRALEAGTLHGHQLVKGGRWTAQAECVDAWVAGHPCRHQGLRVVR